MENLKVLTVWPEWSWAFTIMGKDVENRTWRPGEHMIGKSIALHAGKRVGGRYAADTRGMPIGGDETVSEFFSCFNYVELRAKKAGYSTMILGAKQPKSCCPVTIFQVFKEGAHQKAFGLDKIPYGRIFAVADLEWVEYCRFGPNSKADGWYESGRKVSQWAIPDRYSWGLRNTRCLTSPVLCRGSRGLWDVPQEVLSLLDFHLSNGRYHLPGRG